MSKANQSNNTRRRFLTTVAAAGAAAVIAPAAALASSDPIFALIEAHKAANAALVAAIYRDFDGATAEHEVEQTALVDLIQAVPATLAGVIATMRYISDAALGDEGLLLLDEINPFLANLAEALESLVVRS
jgi:hypothetical protein